MFFFGAFEECNSALFNPSHLKVKFSAGGADDRMSEVHVGSPRYIRDVNSHDATHDDGLDPDVRRLLSTDDIEVDAGVSEGDDRVTSALSVSVISAKMLSIIASIHFTSRILDYQFRFGLSKFFFPDMMKITNFTGLKYLMTPPCHRFGLFVTVTRV